LIYALARADRLTEARAELAKLEAQPRPHALLEELRSFLARMTGNQGAGAAAGGAAALTVDPTKLPKLDTTVTSEERPTGASGVPTDFRAALTQAASAVRSGDLSRAETLYRAALNDQPGNVEALSGLGDVARRRGDAAGAARLYNQVLAKNPSYLPAMIASADYKWASGSRAEALNLYRRILDQAGAGSEYGARAQSRIMEAAESGGDASPKSSAAAPEVEKPAEAPHIDTTDLPGVVP
jgi:tetratricopeptide (TPR) repeat protein